MTGQITRRKTQRKLARIQEAHNSERSNQVLGEPDEAKQGMRGDWRGPGRFGGRLPSLGTALQSNGAGGARSLGRAGFDSPFLRSSRIELRIGRGMDWQ